MPRRWPGRHWRRWRGRSRCRVPCPTPTRRRESSAIRMQWSSRASVSIDRHHAAFSAAAALRTRRRRMEVGGHVEDHIHPRRLVVFHRVSRRHLVSTADEDGTVHPIFRGEPRPSTGDGGRSDHRRSVVNVESGAIMVNALIRPGRWSAKRGAAVGVYCNADQYLFDREPLSAILEKREAEMRGFVDNLDGPELDAMTPSALEVRFSIGTPVLHESERRMFEAEEDVDVSHEPGRDTRRGPVLVPGLLVRIETPYAGGRGVLHWIPPGAQPGPPYGRTVAIDPPTGGTLNVRPRYGRARGRCAHVSAATGPCDFPSSPLLL